MPNNTSIDYSNSPEKSAFNLAEQGTLEIIELMGAADRLKSAGLKDQTIALYRLWLQHTNSPIAYVAYFNLGVELASEREYIQAEEVYRKAIDINPGFTRARLNLGNCLEQQKREDEALEQWRLALETESILLPENQALRLHALNNLGRLFEVKKNYKDSLDKLEESFAVDPTQKDVLLHLVHLIQKICRWPVFNPPKGITKEEMINGTSPLAMLAASDDPKLQLAAAQQFIEHKYPDINSEPLAPKSGYKHEKIRIGYLSSDFCLHAVSLLMVELLELHNHDQFEVYGFCWSRVDDTSIQKRVRNSMDHYIRIAEMSDKEAADCIRSNEIDVMIDLQGLTSGARPLILSYRPAVLQMTYLGFPGTTGLPWIDYVICDKYLIPEELTPFHTEKPLYMPNCFQSSDSKREVGPMPTRAENGLPEKAFVFCSFNNNYKFTPEVFAAWMRILKRVPKSVFWLLADNDWSKENLIKEAKKLGIKKERLIFAPRVAPADYLARYQLADLFLDTFPFNGGTTANDALFMGLPLLTMSGRTFASRMAGSLLTHLELPELITTNLKDYEEKAVKFAKKPAELKVLKERLKVNKATGVVFDLPEFVRNYESKLAGVLEETVSMNNTMSDSIADVSNKEKSTLSTIDISNLQITKNQEEQYILPLLSDVFDKEKRSSALSRLLDYGFLSKEILAIWEENLSRPAFGISKEGRDDFLTSSLWLTINDEMEKKGGELTSKKSKIILNHLVNILKNTGNTKFLDHKFIVDKTVLDYGAGLYSTLSTSIILYANGYKKVIAHEPFPVRVDYVVASVAQTLRWLAFNPKEFIFSGISTQELRQRIGKLDFENIEEKIRQLNSGEKNYIDFNGVAISNSLSTIENESIDLLYSHSVLEYVQNLRSELKLHWNLLQKEAISVHIVDFSDHRAFGGDPNVFQMYYDGVFAEGINGLRPSEIENIFLECHFQGSKISLLNAPKNLIAKERVIERYTPFSVEELSAWVNCYVLSKQIAVRGQVVSKDEIIDIQRLIWPWNLLSDHKIRIGSAGDGGYIMPSFAHSSNLLLSIGIGIDVSFDEELANLGATVLQFDHTIEKSPVEHHNFQFHRIGWGEQDVDNLLSLHSMISMIDWQKVKHPILKFDVEFAEWRALAASTTDDLARFELIAGEFHGFQYLADRGNYELFRSVFEKLAATHYPVHLRANNAGGMKTVSGLQIPQFLEITYMRKDMGIFNGYSFEPIPGPLDEPNYPQLPDIVISPYFDLANTSVQPDLKSTDVLQGPIEWLSLSEYFQKRFTLNGQISLRHWFIRENSPGNVGKIWQRDLIQNGIMQANNRGDLEGIRSYDAKSIFDLYKIFDKYSVVDKDVLIIGSQKPWIEVICIAFGAKSVTTVDFNPPVVDYPGIRTVGVDDFEKEYKLYDILLSFSSLEHDGLGRYGDPIDPDGDIKRMNSYCKIMKPNGIFCLGVPCGKDVLYWNAHRIYGEIRFPMLTASWNTIDFYMDGTERDVVFSIADTCEHAWWVLKPL